MKQEQTPRFLDAKQVGEVLGLKKGRIYELAHEGFLPYFRLGRRMYFPASGLEALTDEAIRRARS